MCNRCLKLKIIKFQNQDMAVFESLYDEFKKLIMYYAVKLHYDDSAGDLTLFFIELLYSIDLKRFDSDESFTIKHYISVAIKNQYITLSMQNDNYVRISNKLYDNLDGYLPDFEDRFSLLECIKTLSHKQKMIIIYRYIYGYSDNEIGVLLGISRQAVNRIKNRALITMKEFLTGEIANEIE